MSGYNPYISILAEKADEEILEILDNQENYHKDVYTAAQKIAFDRGLESVKDLPIGFSENNDIKIIYKELSNLETWESKEESKKPESVITDLIGWIDKLFRI